MNPTLFKEEGVRAEVPDAIPYDLRDSFAALVGESIVAQGGRPAEAEAVTKRLPGHGDGDPTLKRY